MKRKPGRPKLPACERRNHRLQLACSLEGKQAIESAALAAGLPVSHWIEAQAFKRDDGK